MELVVTKLELLSGLTHEAPLWYGYFLDKKVLQDSIISNLFRSDSFDIIFNQAVDKIQGRNTIPSFLLYEWHDLCLNFDSFLLQQLAFFELRKLRNVMMKRFDNFGAAEGQCNASNPFC